MNIDTKSVKVRPEYPVDWAGRIYIDEPAISQEQFDTFMDPFNYISLEEANVLLRRKDAGDRIVLPASMCNHDTIQQITKQALDGNLHGMVLLNGQAVKWRWSPHFTELGYKNLDWGDFSKDEKVKILYSVIGEAQSEGKIERSIESEMTLGVYGDANPMWSLKVDNCLAAHVFDADLRTNEDFKNIKTTEDLEKFIDTFIDITELKEKKYNEYSAPGYSKSERDGMKKLLTEAWNEHYGPFKELEKVQHHKLEKDKER